MKNEKIWFAVVFMVFTIWNNANAEWWDCTVSVEKKDIYGLLYGWDSDMKLEVNADRRSQAESKAVSKGMYATKIGLLGKKNIYICPAGYKTHDGKFCKYRFSKEAVCRRQ